jgi:large subunit ribosomal protein L32
MSKKPTPKKQQSNAQSKRRYKEFQNKTRKRLTNQAALCACPKCKEMKMSHTACPSCGFYKGRVVIDRNKEMDKITKVKA